MRIIIALVGMLALTLGGCALPEEDASTGKQGSSGSESKGGKKQAAKPNDPSVVGNWKIENMKSLRFTEEYGMFKSVDLKVRNVSDEPDTPWFEIRLTNKAGDLVASYDCIGDEYEPKQGGTVDCSSFDDFGPFADWELKNAM